MLSRLTMYTPYLTAPRGVGLATQIRGQIFCGGVDFSESLRFRAAWSRHSLKLLVVLSLASDLPNHRSNVIREGTVHQKRRLHMWCGESQTLNVIRAQGIQCGFLWHFLGIPWGPVLLGFAGKSGIWSGLRRFGVSRGFCANSQSRGSPA